MWSSTLPKRRWGLAERQDMRDTLAAEELRTAIDFYERRAPRAGYVKEFVAILAAACERLAQLDGQALVIPADSFAGVVWQFNEAVSLLREVRKRVALPDELGEEIDDSSPAMQSALEVAARMQLLPLPDKGSE